MGLPKSIALLRAAAAAGETVTLSPERCAEIVEAVRTQGGPPLARVDTETAARILDRPATTVRAMARRFWAMIQDGKEPPIRVWPELSETGAVVRWYFDEGDCWQVRRESGGGPRSVEAGRSEVESTDDLDELDATLRLWGDVALGVRQPPQPA